MPNTMIMNLVYPALSLTDFKPVGTVLDLGANEGGYTAAYLLDGAPRVIAFEAAPKLCQMLLDRFAGDSRVQVVEAVLSDEVGVLKNVTWLNAWVIGDPDKIPLPVSPGACDIVGYDRVDLVTTTLDSQVFDQPITHIKMDVDGYEYRALRGGEALIRRDRPVLYLELSYYINMIEKSSVQGLLDFIASIDYEWATADGRLVSSDVVLREFPWESSCDMFAYPKERRSEWESLGRGSVL